MNRHPKSRLLVYLPLLAGLLLSACGAAAAAAPASDPATATPVVNVVAEATATALPPTATFTPVPPTATPPAVPPTATPSPKPNLTATAAARATQTAAPIIAMIDAELRKFDLSTDEGHLGGLYDPLTIKVNTYGESKRQTDYPDVIVSDFVLQADLTWETSTGLAGCGFVLRSEPDLDRGKQYRVNMIRLQGRPLWDLEYYKHGAFQKNISGDILDAPALNSDQGSTNRITIIAQGNKIAVYANGDRLGVFADNNLSQGTVAFMALQESGETTCTFSNIWVWDLK